MKRRLIIIPILLFCSFIACKKAKGPANGNSVQPNNNLDSTVSISATINGAIWQTDSAFGSLVKYSGNDSGVANLMITATNKNSRSLTTITFNITNYTGPNTYKISPPVNMATYYIGNARHLALQGVIVVSSDTGYALRGTFNFITDTISVANGVFNVATP
jgi:hypothetical protein